MHLYLNITFFNLNIHIASEDIFDYKDLAFHVNSVDTLLQWTAEYNSNLFLGLGMRYIYKLTKRNSKERENNKLINGKTQFSSVHLILKFHIIQHNMNYNKENN